MDAKQVVYETDYDSDEDDFDTQVLSQPRTLSDEDQDSSGSDTETDDEFQVRYERKSSISRKRRVAGVPQSHAPHPSAGKLLRNVCFIWNNPPPEAIDEILDDPHWKYIIVGVEGAEEKKTPHLQCYGELLKRTRFSTVKNRYPRVHLEARKGNAQQAADYCKKEGSFKEKGTISSPGKRTDLDTLRSMVKEGKSWLEIMESCDSAFRYANAVKEYIRIYNASQQTPLQLTLRSWQEQVVALVGTTPHPRTVNWYWDDRGNTGKSTLCRYLVRNFNAFYCTGGKHADISHSYDSQKICLFDFERDQQDKIPYRILTQLKNGMMFSGKYNSHMKIFDSPHVFVFANFQPERAKLSLDRWNVVNLNPLNVNNNNNPIVIVE